MSEHKKDHSTDLLEKRDREFREFLADYDQKFGKPKQGLLPEEQEGLEAEIRHYLRRGHHPK